MRGITAASTNEWGDEVADTIVEENDARASGENTPPERRLLLAILTDAIVGFRKLVAGVHGEQRRQLLETERWIRSNDVAWPCSFINVCESLGIAYEPLRRELLRWQNVAGQKSASISRRVLLGGPSRGRRMRAHERRRPPVLRVAQ